MLEVTDRNQYNVIYLMAPRFVHRAQLANDYRDPHLTKISKVRVIEGSFYKAIQSDHFIFSRMMQCLVQEKDKV